MFRIMYHNVLFNVCILFTLGTFLFIDTAKVTALPPCSKEIGGVSDQPPLQSRRPMDGIKMQKIAFF